MAVAFIRASRRVNDKAEAAGIRVSKGSNFIFVFLFEFVRGHVLHSMCTGVLKIAVWGLL